MKSPVAPAALLMYGIVFFFAAAYYVGIPWEKAYTIGFYVIVLIWSAYAIASRVRLASLKPNGIDVGFLLFLMCVCLSMAITWWEGTRRYLELMPVFFLTPYLLGRVVDVRAADITIIKTILVCLGVVLIGLIVPEFLRVVKSEAPNSSSPTPVLVLFSHGHGVMLSGLLLSAVVVTVSSSILWPSDRDVGSRFFQKVRVLTLYFIMALSIGVMLWIASRGPLVTGILAVMAATLIAGSVTRRRKIEILIVVALSILVAASYAFQRKGTQVYYAELFTSPAVIKGKEDGLAVEPPLQPGMHKSILGNAACSTIAGSISDRWVHYRQAVAIFTSHPIFGVGANNYGFYACTGPGSFPHSTVLQVLAELGVVVGMLYFFLIWKTFRTFLQLARKDQNASAQMSSNGGWLAAFFLMNFFVAQLIGDYFINAAVYFFIGVAASVLANNSVQKMEAHK